VIRELLLGPRRYTDILGGLPGVGSSVLSLRLRELEAAGLLVRHRLAPPAATTVYGLTDVGEDLGPAVDALGRWGLQFMDAARPGDALRPSWMTYSLSISVPIAVLPDNGELGLQLDGEMNTLIRRGDRLRAQWGEPDSPLTTVNSSLLAMYLAVSGQSSRHDPDQRAAFTISGDHAMAERFLDAASGAWRTPAITNAR
jgi:DNA-binding HxlR family transcriptional regulator